MYKGKWDSKNHLPKIYFRFSQVEKTNKHFLI